VSAFERVVVAGAGAFGTALAIIADKAGRKVTLVARDGSQAAAISERRENARYLPGLTLAPSIDVTNDHAPFRKADVVILAAPAQATRTTAAALAKKMPAGTPVVAAAKGIEQGTAKRQTEIIMELLPECRPAVLSGPGFAEEIARGLPTGVTIAANDLALARAISAALKTETFRPYASDDPIGAELGGALKNVLAIACGVIAGRALGESARAALIARGLGEMMRIGATFGAKAETFMGLSGVGDLVLTATTQHSRNTAFGMALGGGERLSELLRPGAPLAEGAHTARVAAEIARRHDVDAPIIAAVAAVIDGKLSVDEAIEGLLSRPLTQELT
jgi:glycerol-3-phosphate dehydrogenase (NAD(P)+)